MAGRNPPNTPTIILAAGGTGGHIFPAVALAEVLASRGLKPVLVTDHRFHDYTKHGKAEDSIFGSLPILTIRAGGIGKGICRKLTSPFGIALGVVQALAHLRRLKPRAVIGFGGYPSFPTVLAAILRRDVTLIHEQNSVLGKANRVLAPYVHAIAATYADPRYLADAMKPKTSLTGNPVRAALSTLHHVPYPMLEADGMLRILVIGGSQGASVFSDIIPQAIERLSDKLRLRIRIDQQCREGEMETVRARYAAMGLQADIKPFFADVAVRVASAHLVISRAGASSVAELTAAGRPAIFVPLPSATDNHQYFNAEAIEDLGGGWVMAQEAFTAEALAAKLETYLRSPRTLQDAADRMRLLGRPKAAEALADLVMARAKLSV